MEFKGTPDFRLDIENDRFMDGDKYVRGYRATIRDRKSGKIVAVIVSFRFDLIVHLSRVCCNELQLQSDQKLQEVPHPTQSSFIE